MPRRETKSKTAWLLLGWLTWHLFSLPKLLGQQVRFPESTYAPTTSNPWNPPVSSGSPVFPPSNPTAPWPTASGTSTGLTAGPATLTPIGPPYATGGVPGTTSVGATIRPNSSPLLPSYTGQLPPTAYTWNPANWFGMNSGYNQPLQAGQPFGSSPTLPNTYPPSVYPNASPPMLFPNGYGASPPAVYGGTVPSNSVPGAPYPNSSTLGNMNGPLLNGPIPLTSRFLVAPRFRDSWIAGGDQPDDLGVNDNDLSLLFQVPKFLGCTQPLYIAPSFSVHLWDGPKNSVADLPGSAYSAFLDFGWETDPLRTFGTELGIRVGVFSEWDIFTDDSLRILGKALGRIRLTPTSTARLGVYWLDRNSIKLLPAVGILWVPNAETRFDIFFPEPKLSHYVTTVGNKDMWWYASGYLGGGTWTVERASGQDDSVDLNDWRFVLGLEWGRNEQLRQGHRCAFFEGGYVFNRELIYRYSPEDNIDIEDSFVLRAGIYY